MAFNVAFYNVIVLGLCFMFVFTAFQTSSNVQTPVLNSIVRDGKKIFDGKGYTSLSIIYAVFSVANFIAPPIVSVVGPRVALLLSGLTYCIFIGSLIYPFVWSLYLASVIVGFGAAVIWTAQGNFLTINSNHETMGRNSGIFWALLQCSLLFGNMFVYFYLNGKSDISAKEGRTIFTVLSSCCFAGTLCFLFLRKAPGQSQEDNQNTNDPTPRYEEKPLLQDEMSPSYDSTSTTATRTDDEQFGSSPRLTPFQIFVRSFQMLATKNMAFISVTTAYTGFELTFFSGVYGTSVANTGLLKNNKQQLGLVGMLIGIGEITGGLIFGIFGKRTNKYGRDPIVLLGFVIHMVTFFLILLNIPDHAPIGQTMDDTHLHNNIHIISLCAYMLGFGDSCFNTQIYSLLGSMYSEDSASAFALFKFVQSVAAAIAFGYALATPLKWQLLVLVVTGVLGTISFFAVERNYRKMREQHSAS
ncbi:UNC93-like protein MFSD11 [Rhopilema esculentum]|uniref:UNC93-like protein MFSD11 n=1 Tax=Rhopilema esculentum TaxID=499914 RepID=UPI0031D76ED6